MLIDTSLQGGRRLRPRQGNPEEGAERGDRPAREPLRPVRREQGERRGRGRLHGEAVRYAADDRQAPEGAPLEGRGPRRGRRSRRHSPRRPRPPPPSTPRPLGPRPPPPLPERARSARPWSSARPPPAPAPRGRRQTRRRCRACPGSRSGRRQRRLHLRVNGHLAGKLSGSRPLRLASQGAVLALSREVVEKVVWEVVPQLAEALIKEEIQRLTRPLDDSTRSPPPTKLRPPPGAPTAVRTAIRWP